MNNNRLLLDTNVLIYLKDSQSAYYLKALELVENFDGDVFTTSKNLSEYLVATTRGDTPILTIEEALVDINEFSNLFTVLYPTANSYQEFTALLKKYGPKGLKIHDYEIAAIALNSGIDQIATLNVKDFSNISELRFYQWF